MTRARSKPMPDARPDHGSRRTSRVLTPDTYRSDPMFPRVEQAVLAILANGKVVAPVEVLVRMGTLRAEDLEAWRLGRIPFLEQVIQGNLSRLRRFLGILGFLCHDLNLSASVTAYVRRGEGGSRPLRFTKTGEPRLERIYARHFVWPGKGPFHLPRGRASDADSEAERAKMRKVARKTHSASYLACQDRA